MLVELSDPERFAHHLRVFSQLALLDEALHPCRFPVDAFVDAVLSAVLPDVPDDEDAAISRQRALREAVVPPLMDAGLLASCQAAIQKALVRASKREAILALTAGGALASACEQSGATREHAFWEILFELTLTEALLSSQLLTKLVQGELSVDAVAVGRIFAKALTAGEFAAELDALGMTNPDPTRLAQRYAELVFDREPHHFQFDAVLHLALLHVELAETAGREIARFGLTPALKDSMRSRYEEAFAADVTPKLVEEVCGWYQGYLSTLRDDPESLEDKLPRSLEDERERALVCYLVYKSIAPEANQLLRAVHVQSLARSRVATAPDEQAFVGRLWSNPTDSFALGDYEKFLLERQDRTRSRRVHAFRDTLRRRKKQEIEARTQPQEPEREQ